MTSSVSKGPARRYRFADLTLDLGRHAVWRGAEQIRLSKLTYELLRVLVEQSPDVASNDELANRIWGSRRVVTPENLAKRVMLLRQALGDNAEQPRYIERVRCLGYRLIPEVEEVQPQDETGAPRQRPAIAAQRRVSLGAVLVSGARVAGLGRRPCCSSSSRDG